MIHGPERAEVLSAFAPDARLGLTLLVAALAVASKLATALVVYRRDARRWPVGVGMVPRGEVGLIFAGTGLAAGVIAAISKRRWCSW